MIADTALISRAPIILIDEIENAGIDKNRALSLLCGNARLRARKTAARRDGRPSRTGGSFQGGAQWLRT